MTATVHDQRPAPAPGGRPDDPPPWHHLRGLLNPRFLVAFVVALLAVEGAARLFEARDRTAPTVMAEHVRRLEDGPPVDMLVIGSSSVGADIWSPHLESSGLACNAYVPWLASPTMVDIERYWREGLLPAQRPDRLVIGVTMREMNGRSPVNVAADLESLLAERGRLKALAYNLAILRIRPTLQNPRHAGDVLLGRDRPHTDPDGHLITTLDRRIADESASHRRQEERAMAQYELGRSEVDALRRVIDDAREQGIDVVVLNLPVTDLFIGMAPRGQADYDEYLPAVRAAAISSGATFIDGATVPLDVETAFADVNHLNRNGSMAFTTALIEGELATGRRPSCS
jgi:hypothetical protein